MTGKIKIPVRVDKGFCFIQPDEGGRDIFCHVKDLDPALPFDDSLVGCRVEFETRSTERGIQAKNVRGI